MEYWEFLLQQEGDSDWLPLDTSQMEILEGRYRIMAHCSGAQTSVQIKISQVIADQMPPKRRSLSRQGHTNENGLLVVLPFTRLTAGTWDVFCQSVPQPSESDAAAAEETSSQAEENAWQYAIQLRVLPQGVGEDGDWFADDGDSQTFRAGTQHSHPADPHGSDSGSPTHPAAGGESSVPSLGISSKLDPQQLAEAIDQAQANTSDPDSEPDTLYTLGLNQTALMATQGQAIHLSGSASSVIEGESCSDMVLAVRLSDPQTAEVLALAPFGLESKTLPASFSAALPLPDTLATRLLLGELALIAQQGNAFNLLALKRFTVTVDLAALFDEIANRAEADDSIDLVFAPDQLSQEDASPSLPGDADNLSGWEQVNFPAAPPRSVPTLTLPRSTPKIPPKIYYPSPHEISARKPVLPPLGEVKRSDLEPFPTSAPPAADAAQPAPSTSLQEDTPNDGGEDNAPSSTPASTVSPPQPATSGLSLPPLRAPADSTAAASQGEGRGDGSTQAASRDGEPSSAAKPEGLMLPSHEAMAFKALNLQERFWTRLNDLAVTIQQEAQQVKAAPSDPQTDAPPEAPETEQPVFIPFEGEVVIYEEVEPSLGELTPDTAAALVDRLQQGEEVEIPTPPVPEIEIASTELTAGEPLLLTLKVPFHPNRLYLKVWITDPQTRSLTDEPRQLTHLMPNGRGQLEGAVQLTVPMGCLEIWLEAISVDMVTQQESYKTSVACAVSPLDIETASLDEFEL